MARVALVTGGTRGIGADICRALKAAGRTVVASYAGNEEAAVEQEAVRTREHVKAAIVTEGKASVEKH